MLRIRARSYTALSALVMCCIASNAEADPSGTVLTTNACATSGPFEVDDLFACDGLLKAEGLNGPAFMTYDPDATKFKMYGANSVLKLTFSPTISSFDFNASVNQLQGTLQVQAFDANDVQVGSTVNGTGPNNISGAGIETVIFTASVGANGFLAWDFDYALEGSVAGCADCSGNPIPPPPPPDYDNDSIPDDSDPDDDNDGVIDDDDTEDHNVNVCGVDEDDDNCDDCSAGGTSPSTATDGVNSDSDPDGLCDAYDRKTLNISACSDTDLDDNFACDGLASGSTEVASQPVVNSTTGISPNVGVAGAGLSFNFNPAISRFSFVAIDAAGVPFTTGTVNGTGSSGSLTPVTFEPGETVVVTGPNITALTIDTDTTGFPAWYITEVSLDPVERVVGCDATCTGTPLDDLDGDDIPDSIDPDIDGDTVENEDDPLPLEVDICGLDEDEDTCDDCLGDGATPDEDSDGIDSDQDGICDLGDNRPLVEVHPFPGGITESGCGDDGGYIVISGIDRDGDHVLDGFVGTPDPSPTFPSVLPPVPQTTQEIYHAAIVCNNEHLLVDHDFVPSSYQCPAGGVELTFVLDANRNGEIDLGMPAPEPPPPFVFTPAELPEYDSVYMSTTLCHGINASIESSELPVGNEVCPTGGVHVTFSLEAYQAPGAPQWPSSPSIQSAPSNPLPEPVSYDICNGANALVTVEPVTAGSQYCKNGGYIAEMGTDLDGSGTFNDEEPSASTPICHGLNSLVKTTTLAVEDANCPTGGIKVESGLDDDGDLALEADEVDATEYVCHGADSITKTTAIESGSEACPTGGRQIEIGKDADGDGVLDAGEVSSTELICNGSGLAVRSTRLSTGNVACPGGGVVVETGIDSDGDRTLDDSEVQSSETLCDAVNALFDTETLAEDPDVCPHGGIRVKMGRDDGLPTGNAANNLLEAGEVEATRDVCLASTDVLVNGGSSECSISPGGASSGSTRWATLGTLLVAGLALGRRGRRGESRK